VKDDKVRLAHIIEALDRIDSHVSMGERDQKTASAVLYELTIIGEASRHIEQVTKDKIQNVPWIDIIGMRNRIVHEYFSIDYPVLWATVEQDLPSLRAEIEKYLSF